MSRCSLDSENTLDRLLTHDGVTKAVSDVREFLIFRPVDFVFFTTIVIVMRSGRSVFQEGRVTDFLSLREPCSCWLSPSVVELKEFVIEMVLDLGFGVGVLVKSSRDIALFIEALGTDLSDVHVNHVAVVSVNVEKLVFS